MSQSPEVAISEIVPDESDRRFAETRVIPDPAGTEQIRVGVEPQEAVDNVFRHATSDFVEVTVHGVKQQLLKMPINAYTEALRLADAFTRTDQAHMAALYLEAARQLRHDGYAPAWNGDPGPAVADYYARQAAGDR
jgi:hypothetical protein